MKRRTLDIIFSIGGLTLAVLVLVLGLVLRSNAVFAQNYVHDQLAPAAASRSRPAENLSPEEQQSAGLVKLRRPAAHHGRTGPGVCERLHRGSTSPR